MDWNKRRLKVLFFTESLGWGGITRVILNLLKGIDRDQVTPFITVYHSEGVRMSELPQGIQVYSLNVQREGKGTELFKLFLTYRKVLKEVDPDVVVSSVWKPNILSLIAQMIDFSKKPKLILRLDMAFSPYFREIHGGGLKSRISLIITKLLYPRADHIIAVSEGLKKESVCFGIPEENITVIYNPLDLKAIDELKRDGIEIDKPFILFVGRLCRQKNISLLIQAYHLIKDEWDGNLLILGRGEEETHLKNFVKTLKIEKRVLFKSYVCNPFPYMHHAQVLVLSSDSEGFPCVLLEAMACGAPVVSTDCPHGPREIISDGVNGFLVPVGNASRLAEALKEVLKNSALRESFIEQGYKSIQPYEINGIARRYEKLIVDVCSPPGSGKGTQQVKVTEKATR